MHVRSNISNIDIFIEYAGTDINKWNKLAGQQIYHSLYGKGTVVNIQKQYLFLQFEQFTRKFHFNALSNKCYFSTITLPDDIEDINILIDAKKEAVKQDLKKIYEFEKLKKKYLKKHPNMTMTNDLYCILLNLESHNKLNHEEIEWLEKKLLFSPIAIFYQKKHKESESLLDLIEAVKYWRKARMPKTALKLTFKIQLENNKMISALLTTRGGVLRDMGKLKGAEKCALEALQYNPHGCYCYNLLGAIYYQLGNPNKGDEYFKIAEQLGSRTDIQEAAIFDIFERKANPKTKEVIAINLSKKDTIRYKWAKDYLLKRTKRHIARSYYLPPEKLNINAHELRTNHTKYNSYVEDNLDNFSYSSEDNDLLSDLIQERDEYSEGVIRASEGWFYDDDPKTIEDTLFNW
ncbi:MAG: hypothetical protein SVX43_21710 [Cyanobacteriota bacterium]|nr:hypothetical protein [Cyanobacteriota bacterium]